MIMLASHLLERRAIPKNSAGGGIVHKRTLGGGSHFLGEPQRFP